MYGKLFDSMYDGTLVEDWRSLITFQQMIILCDADGIIDMTHSAISRRTGIPIEHIKAGIEILENKDPYSRTPDEDGKRIELIDSHRPWGWHIVNHEKYKNLIDADTIRAQTRERVRKHREKQKECNGESVTVTQCNDSKRYIDTDINKDKTKKKKNGVKEVEKVYPPELNLNAWNEYLVYRKEAKIKKLTPSGEKKQIKKLIEFGDYVTQQKCIDESISNGWSGIFPLKNNNGDNNGKRNLSAVEQVEQATRKPAYNL